ncbi:MAG: sll0787 family AIR synthase-like protein [Deltaproteobacteria bacterium]|nr:sll0787 family AIR synthase-like protein [Deltaproteobacteria bacterium]
MPELDTLLEALRSAEAWQRKREIASIAQHLSSPFLPTERCQETVGQKAPEILVGDDAAAIPDGDGFLLLAAEVILPDLVTEDPYLAGRVAVLANANDIYAMGGRPVALVDTVTAPDCAVSGEILRGLKDSCRRYGVPLVGGHLTANATTSCLTAAILGRAERLISGAGARPGDRLLHVTSLQGEFVPARRFWNGTAHRSGEELRGDLEVLPTLAEAGLCDAGRDISMAGLLGSLLMLLELSGVGAVVDLESIPTPPGARDRLLDWLLASPSYGFILAVRPHHENAVGSAFAARGLTCECIGQVTPELRLRVRHRKEGRTQEGILWDLQQQPFMGLSTSPPPMASSPRQDQGQVPEQQQNQRDQPEPRDRNFSATREVRA